MKKNILLITLTSLCMLTACQPPQMYKDATNNVLGVSNRINDIDARANNTPAVVEKHSAYVDLTPMALSHNPAWFKDPISLRTQDMPFDFVAKKVTENVGVPINYGTGIDTAKTVSLNYSGSVQGALERLAAKSGYAYKVADDGITWSGLLSQTFDVSFMPGVSSYMMGQQQQQNGGGGLSSTSNQGSGSMGQQQTDEFSNIAGSLSVWHDLESTLNNLKSSDGKIEVSQATTTVTVEDHPSNVKSMQQYIDRMNKTLSRQVVIQVQVLEVELNDQFNFGIDWNLIAGKFHLGQGSTNRPISFEPTGDTDNSANTLGVGILNTDGSPRGTNLLLHYMQEQGNVSTETYPRVITMNNQVAEIGINTQTAYLAQTSTTNTFSSSATAAQPSIITDGFTLYVLPKIQGDKVYMQISSTLARLLKITTQSAGNNTTIQLPQVTYKRFNQRTVVTTGATLILAGFKQISNGSNATGPLGSWQLGGKNSAKRNIETIVLITPTIIGSK